MTLDLTVLIPTLKERGLLFSEAHTSVLAQTLPVHCGWTMDVDREGPATIINRMATKVDTEWLFRLDDDDLLDPDHFEVLSHWLTNDADIVFTWCRVEGGGDLHPEDQFQVPWQGEMGWGALRERNWIPCSAAIRTSLFHELGGYNVEAEEEDWDFWIMAFDAGANFRCIPAVTWTYRMNPEWKHRSSGESRTWAKDDGATDSEIAGLLTGFVSAPPA